MLTMRPVSTNRMHTSNSRMSRRGVAIANSVGTPFAAGLLGLLFVLGGVHLDLKRARGCSLAQEGRVSGTPGAREVGAWDQQLTLTRTAARINTNGSP